MVDQEEARDQRRDGGDRGELEPLVGAATAAQGGGGARTADRLVGRRRFGAARQASPRQRLLARRLQALGDVVRQFTGGVVQAAGNAQGEARLEGFQAAG